MATGFMTHGFKQRAGLAILEAGLVVGVLYFLGYRDWLFIGSIAGAIALSALSPPRYSGLVTGICLLALAALFHFHFKLQRLPMVLGVAGLIFCIYGLVKFRIVPRKF